MINRTAQPSSDEMDVTSTEDCSKRWAQQQRTCIGQSQ